MKAQPISVRPLREGDLDTADHIMRLAFGTYRGLPEPAAFMGDAALIRSRWTTDPSAAFAAEAGGELIGSNLTTNWGSVGFFGPLTIRPDCWDRGAGKRLMEPIMAKFEQWGTRHAGLFTFADSAKHVGLYHKFGFWPRFLTAIMSKPVEPGAKASGWTRFSDATEGERDEILQSCRELTGSVYDGLDVSREVESVVAQSLGDAVLLWRASRLSGLAVCHYGAGSEGGSGVCYIKFGAARPGAPEDFDSLLAACEQMAAEQGLARVTAGMNAGRSNAYTQTLRRGFRTDFQGVAMQRPNDAGYNRPDVYLIDDWR